jgi:hypothetical protein
LRNALAVALTVPPRDIRLRAVDTAGGVVDFQVVGGRAARHAVEEAVDVTHTNNENYGILASMGTIDGLTFADNPVMTENLVLATCMLSLSLSLFILQTIILPSQARDKHRENSKKSDRFQVREAHRRAMDPSLGRRWSTGRDARRARTAGSSGR